MKFTPKGAKRFLVRCYFRLKNMMYRIGLLSTEGIDFPDFLCVGAQKAGTTWLHANLREHPGIYLPEFKEIHYFNGGWGKHSLNWYGSIFSEKGLKKGGDMTPGYSELSAQSVEFMHMLMPNAKIIFLLRNPIERAWSAAKMHLTVLSGRCYEDVSEEEFIEHFKSEHSLKRGDYINIYKRYAKCFGQENIFVGFQEEIEQEPKKLLIDVFHFLGITTYVDWKNFNTDQKIGGAKYVQEMPIACRKALEEIYCDKIVEYESFFGKYASEWKCKE